MPMLKSYTGWLHVSLFCVGLPAVAFAWLGWQLSSESSYRVERGRIASDIHTALTRFELYKLQLRNWSIEQVTSKQSAPDERLSILAKMEAQAAAFSKETQQAITLDLHRGKSLQEHQDREALTALLQAILDKLNFETETYLDIDAPDLTALQKINTEFLQLGEVSLSRALSEARRHEAVLLAQERERADQSLSRARQMFLSAGASVSVLTLIVAMLLSKRLRTPFLQLGHGIRAYQTGDFAYRFADFQDAEFSTLADQLNSMAAEVSDSRSKSALHQENLERLVVIRTAELRAALDDISAAEAARKQLLADIGHELRTPITILQGEAQVALRSKDMGSQSYRRSLELIVTVARQMGGLIEDLVDLVRDPALDVKLNLQDVSLKDVIGMALDAAQGLGATRDIRVERLKEIPEVSLVTDPDRLRQVLICVLDNAIRYSRAGSTVKLDAAVSGQGKLGIRVIDTGIGIDAGDMARIWDRGWRSDAARSHRPDGLGLGLSISRRLTRLLGGALEISSDGRECGTIVTLNFTLGAHQPHDGTAS